MLSTCDGVGHKIMNAVFNQKCLFCTHHFLTFHIIQHITAYALNIKNSLRKYDAFMNFKGLDHQQIKRNTSQSRTHDPIKDLHLL